ncbi:MAG: non-hydrolyzing UDP-N-acetylglucosamine 2-epimerase [Chloroflexota bacterium]
MIPKHSSSDTTRTALVVLGTRPEAIKLAPVVQALDDWTNMRVRVVSTGQHREMLAQTLSVFGLEVDHDLDVMTHDQTLSQVTSRILSRLDPVFDLENPDVVIVQGDTTTALSASLAAFYRKTPVAHVEAGLRTDDRYAPFPEEINRRMVSTLADWHFAPTQTSASALRREGILESSIYVTGNTVIDAMRQVLATTTWPEDLPAPAGRVLLVTAHRRENFGASLEAICRAIRRIADEHCDVEVWYPVHRNPKVRGPVEQLLSCHPGIRLVEPLDYVSFTHLLARSHLVLTDSGGVQEEAPALAKPVLVMREVTERPEAVEAGVVELVGTDEDHIVRRTSRLLNDPAAYKEMAREVSPYGDGLAAKRIVDVLCKTFRTESLLGRTRGHEKLAVEAERLTA